MAILVFNSITSHERNKSGINIKIKLYNYVTWMLKHKRFPGKLNIVIFCTTVKVFQKCCTTSSLFVEFIIAVELMVSEICITFKFFSNYNDYYFY